MRVLVVSSSLDPKSRSERLAHLCVESLQRQGCAASYLGLKEHRLPGFDNDRFSESEGHRLLHAAVSEADGLVLASPVYNWDCCAELKKFVEYVGSTDPGRSLRGAFFDKVVTFVNAAGLPHSYMAFTSLANSMMLDFKCVVNPYNVYVHDRHWDGEALGEEARARLEKSMGVMAELTSLLRGRRYKSGWEI